MARAALVLLVTLLLAGCLEEPTAPAPAAGVAPSDVLDVVPTLPLPTPDPTPLVPTPEELPPPTPTPVPTEAPPIVTPVTPTVPPPPPTEDRRTLHRNARHLSGDPQLVRVPADIEMVQLVVEANGSWSGRVSLLRPDGSVALACPPSCNNLQSATPGAWSLDFTDDVPGDLTATVYGYPYPSSNPRVPTHYAYFARHAFVGPTTNVTDYVTVAPGHAGMRGMISVESPNPADDSPARITLVDPKGVEVVACVAVDCPFSVTEPAPGLWRLWYSQGGNGTGYANVSLIGETTRPKSMYGYLGGHAYASHPNRAEFGEGFTVPPGVKTLRFGVSLKPADAATPDPSDDALVELRAPDGTIRAACGWATTGAGCAIDVQDPPPGRWVVQYRGADSRSHANVFAKIE